MAQRTLALAALVLPIATLLVPRAHPGASAPAAAAVAWRGGDLEDFVRGEAEQESTRGPRELWTRAMKMREAESLGEKGELDAVLDGLLGKPEALSPAASLLLSAARLQGDKAEAGLIARALVPLAGAPDEELGFGAATLLA